MNRISIGRLLLVAALLAGSAGCDTREPTTPTAPTAPQLKTDTFTGAVTVNGAAVFSFLTASAGTVTATLKTVSPDASAVLGLALGTWNGSACQVTIDNPDAKQGITVTGVVSGIGGLCTRVYDVGKLTGAVSIEVVVVHP